MFGTCPLHYPEDFLRHSYVSIPMFCIAYDKKRQSKNSNWMKNITIYQAYVKGFITNVIAIYLSIYLSMYLSIHPSTHAVQGIKPRPSHTPDKCSTSELHPQLTMASLHSHHILLLRKLRLLSSSCVCQSQTAETKLFILMPYYQLTISDSETVPCSMSE
jgi:hypothetical protein